MKTLLLGAACVASVAFGSAAVAGPITFEGHANSQYDNTTITREGMTFSNVAGDEQHFHEIDPTPYGLVDNGTGVFLVDRDTRAQMVAQDASIFTLGNFDISSAYANATFSYAVTGYLNNVLVGTLTGALPSSSFLTLSGASLGNVDRVVFDGIGGQGYFQLDNINVGAANGGVPEPASWAMMLGGFGAIGAAMRRRRKAAVSFG